MTEGVPVDRDKLLHEKREKCSAIARSRKRKLCILYEVTVCPDGSIPKRSFADPDAYVLPPDEAAFLDGCDILQGRRLNELNLPRRPPRPDPTSTKVEQAPQIITKTNPPQTISKTDAPPPPKPHIAPAPITTVPPSPLPSENLPSAPDPDLKGVAPTEMPELLEAEEQTPAPNAPAAIEAKLPEEQGESQKLMPSKEIQGRHEDHSSSPMDVDSPVSKLPLSDGDVKTQDPVPAHIINETSNTTPATASPVVEHVSRKTTSPENILASSNQPEISVDSKAQHNRVVENSTLDQQTRSQVEAQLVRDSADAVRRDSTKVEVRPSQTQVPSLPPAHDKSTDSTASELADVEPKSPLGHSRNIVERPAEIESKAPVPDHEKNLDEKPDKNTASEKVIDVVQPRKPQESVIKPSPLSPTPSANREPPRALATDVALQKPVSEILGERLEPKIDGSSNHGESQATHSMPITPTSQSSKLQSQSLLSKTNLGKRKRTSTVVFGKRPQPQPSQSIVPKDVPADHLSDDYFTSLFVNSFASGSKWMKPLDQVLHQAHKTLSTDDSYTQFDEHQACRVLRRVYILQQNDKWSLRQPRRCPEPIRQKTHWDILLDEVKWMRTDFRQERKLRMTVCRNLAEICALWVESTAEERKAMQINAIIPSLRAQNEDMPMADAELLLEPENQPTPDLIPSNSDSPLEPDEILEEDFLQTAAPSAIFALHDDEVIFPLRPSAVGDRLLEELPMYSAPLEVPKTDMLTTRIDPDASWKRKALCLSKYAEGRMELSPEEPPKRKGRYDYTHEDDEDEEIVFGLNDTDNAEMPLPPRDPDVALFRSENKSIRDRLHAGHQFRPPSEHNMPTLAFYESRVPSTWLQSEDDELKGLVREYSYNWSLISSLLTAKSTCVSATERRTPWECFERWVMLEGLPHDMQKTQYFKLWQSRIEQAQQFLRQQQQLYSQQQAQQQQAQQQAQSQDRPSQQGQQPSQAGTAVPTTPLTSQRRMYAYSLPCRIPRRRNGKHYIMLESMRKLAKKRETNAQKAQQNAQLAAARKANEAPQAKPPSKTPREYSIMRWERDKALAEKVAERVQQQQRQHEAQRRAAIQRVQQNQIAQMANAAQTTGQMPQGTPQMAASHPHSAAMARAANVSNQMAANGQARPRMAMPMPTTPGGGADNQGHMATGGLVPPMQMAGSPQIQVPVVNGQAQMSMPASVQNRMLLQAQQISEQQRQSVQQQIRQRQLQQQQQQQQLQQSQQAQQMQAQHTPGAQHHQQLQQQQQQQMPQQQLQHQQQSPAGQQMNGSLQNSPPGMRAAVMNGMNGMNQRSYMSNAQAQAIMASYNAANGAGSSTSPGAGLSLPNGQSGSPQPNTIIPPQANTTYVSQLQAIENQIRSNHPNAPQEKVREMARALLQNRHNSITQSAMNAAAGGAGQTAFANGPHQYAQLLRAQQQQQAAAAAAKTQAQAQAHAQAQSQNQAQAAQAQATGQTSTPQGQQMAQHNSVQHQRNSSGSATPTPSISQ